MVQPALAPPSMDCQAPLHFQLRRSVSSLLVKTPSHLQRIRFWTQRLILSAPLRFVSCCTGSASRRPLQNPEFVTSDHLHFCLEVSFIEPKKLSSSSNLVSYPQAQTWWPSFTLCIGTTVSSPQSLLSSAESRLRKTQERQRMLMRTRVASM